MHIKYFLRSNAASELSETITTTGTKVQHTFWQVFLSLQDFNVFKT